MQTSDLLPIRWDGEGWCPFGQLEAPGLGQELPEIWEHSHAGSICHVVHVVKDVRLDIDLEPASFRTRVASCHQRTPDQQFVLFPEKSITK